MKRKFEIEIYNIGFMDTTILTDGIKKNGIKWVKHRYRDRFFADPFLWKRDDKYYYILVEEKVFIELYGKISMLTVDKQTLEVVDKKTILEKPYHLSWPYCEEGENYMIPESGSVGISVMYILDTDTLKIIEEIPLSNYGLIDPVFYKDYIIATNNDSPNESLFIYKKKDSLYVPTSSTPIQKDSKLSRSAGKIFKYNNIMIRPVQDCSERYGKYTHLMAIENIDENNYTVMKKTTFTSKFSPPFNETLHTFNYYEDFILVDGSYKAVTFGSIIYKFRIMFRHYIGNFLRK